VLAPLRGAILASACHSIMVEGDRLDDGVSPLAVCPYVLAELDGTYGSFRIKLVQELTEHHVIDSSTEMRARHSKSFIFLWHSRLSKEVE